MMLQRVLTASELRELGFHLDTVSLATSLKQLTFGVFRLVRDFLFFQCICFWLIVAYVTQTFFYPSWFTVTRSLLIYFAYEFIGLCLECILVRRLSQNSIKSVWDWIGVVMGYINRHILLGDWLLFPVAFYFKQVTLGRIALLCCIIAYVFFLGAQQLRLLLALYSASDPYLIANANRNAWIPTIWTFGREQNNNSSESAFPQHTASYIPVLFSMFCRWPVRQWLKWEHIRRWNPVTRYYSLRYNVSSTTEDDDADCKQKRSELILRAPLNPFGSLSQEVLPNNATHPSSTEHQEKRPSILNDTKSYDNVTCEQSTTATSETHVSSVTATQLDHSCDDNGASTAAFPKIHLQQAIPFANQLTNEPPSVLRLPSRQYLPPSDSLPPSEADVEVQPPHPGDLSVYYFSYTILLYLFNCFDALDTLNVWFRHRVWPQRRTSSSTLTYSATLESSDNALYLNNVLEPLTNLSSQPQRCFFSASTAHNVAASENFTCPSPHAVRQRWLTNYSAAQSACSVPFLKVIQLAHCSQLTDRFSIQNVLRRIYLSPQYLEQHEFCTAVSTIGRCFLGDILMCILKVLVLINLTAQTPPLSVQCFLWASTVVSLTQAFFVCLYNTVDDDVWRDIASF